MRKKAEKMREKAQNLRPNQAFSIGYAELPGKKILRSRSRLVLGERAIRPGLLQPLHLTLPEALLTRGGGHAVQLGEQLLPHFVVVDLARPRRRLVAVVAVEHSQKRRDRLEIAVRDRFGRELHGGLKPDELEERVFRRLVDLAFPQALSNDLADVLLRQALGRGDRLVGPALAQAVENALPPAIPAERGEPGLASRRRLVKIHWRLFLIVLLFRIAAALEIGKHFLSERPGLFSRA